GRWQLPFPHAAPHFSTQCRGRKYLAAAYLKTGLFGFIARPASHVAARRLGLCGIGVATFRPTMPERTGREGIVSEPKARAHGGSHSFREVTGTRHAMVQTLQAEKSILIVEDNAV